MESGASGICFWATRMQQRQMFIVWAPEHTIELVVDCKAFTWYIKEHNKSWRTIYFEGAQIGSSLDRGPGRSVHTDSHTNNPWRPLGAGSLMVFQGSGRQRTPGTTM